MYARFTVALLAITLVAQQKPKTEIREIRATGCVRKASEAHCLVLQTLDGGTTYTFLAAPQPEQDAVITIQGRAHEGRSVCKQGIPIDIIDWEPTGERCEAPKK